MTARVKDDYKGILIATVIIVAWTAHLLFVLRLPEPSLAETIVHIVIQANLSIGLFITAHDAMHGVVAPGRRNLNHAFGALTLFMYAAFFFERVNRLHHQHHDHPATLKDPDYAPDTREQFFSWLWTFMTRYYSWKNFAIMHLYVLALWAYSGSFLSVWLFYAVPTWIAALQLFYFGTYLTHKTPTGGHTHPHRAVSNNFPVWLSFLTCYHFGYHEEHHDHPHVPWWRLPQIRKEALAAVKETGL